MSTAGRGGTPVNETERDRDVDAAWNAASREEPPLALDAAIRAEARRAVGAAPGGVRRGHWSYPLAAAATVAALAIGIAQLTPPEQVAPTIVAEHAVAPKEAANDTARQLAARSATSSPAAPATPPAAAPPPKPAQKAPAETQPAVIEGAARERGAAPAPQALAKKQLQANEESAARDKFAAAPAEKPAAAASGAVGVEERTPTAPPRSEPFPASPGAGVARRDANAAAPTSESNAPARVAAAQAPRALGAPASAQAAAGAAHNESRIEAKVAPVDEAGKAKDAAGRSVEDWIKRIRELKNAERFDDTAKELAAFRAAFGERADALLPPDLRAWTPPAK